MQLATTKVKTSKSEETTAQLKNVLSYVTYSRTMKTVDRDLVLLRGLERNLEAGGDGLGSDATKKQKKRAQKKSGQQFGGSARREDLVSLWDFIVQVRATSGVGLQILGR